MMLLRVTLISILASALLISILVYTAPQATSQRLIIFNTTGNATLADGNTTIVRDGYPMRLAIPRNIVDEPPGNRTTAAGAEPPAPPSATVFIQRGAALKGEDAFLPNPVRINRGGVVTWVNEDLVTHTVTFGSGFDDPNMGKVFDSGLMGATYNKAFDISGDFSYFCQVHPTMVGTVIVAATEEFDIIYSEEADKAANTTEPVVNETFVAESEAVEQQQNVAKEGSVIQDNEDNVGADDQGNILDSIAKFFEGLFDGM